MREIKAKIDESSNRIEIESTADAWAEFGYWLEATGFMAVHAMRYKEWSKERILDYTTKYIANVISDWERMPVNSYENPPEQDTKV